jgi:hypothetical protein
MPEEARDCRHPLFSAIDNADFAKPFVVFHVFAVFPNPDKRISDDIILQRRLLLLLISAF